MAVPIIKALNFKKTIATEGLNLKHYCYISRIISQIIRSIIKYEKSNSLCKLKQVNSAIRQSKINYSK